MGNLDFDIERSELNFAGMVNEFKAYENEHGFLFKILYYSALACSIMVFLQMVGLRIYSSLVSKFFNISFRFRGAFFNVYQLFLGVIIFVGAISAIFKLQTEQFTKNLQLDTPEKKLYRLKYKWIVEEQLWLVTLILFEIVAIWRLSLLYDREVALESQKEELDIIVEKNLVQQEAFNEDIPNVQTQASYND